MIHIEIRKCSSLKNFFQYCHSKLEDMIFSLIMKLPERIIPSFLMDVVDQYLNKRINDLERQNVKQTWRSIQLQDAIDSIHHKDKKKAPTEE